MKGIPSAINSSYFASTSSTGIAKEMPGQGRTSLSNRNIVRKAPARATCIRRVEGQFGQETLAADIAEGDLLKLVEVSHEFIELDNSAPLWGRGRGRRNYTDSEV